MAERNISALPVTTGDGALIGAIRREDIERAHAAAARDEEPSEEVAEA